MANNKLSDEQLDALLPALRLQGKTGGAVYKAITQLRTRCQELEAFRKWICRKIRIDEDSLITNIYGEMHVQMIRADEHSNYCNQGKTQWHQDNEQLRSQLATVTAERDELREQGQHLLFAMSPELWETLKKAEADIKAGRVHDHEDVIRGLTQQEASDDE